MIKTMHRGVCIPVLAVMAAGLLTGCGGGGGGSTASPGGTPQPSTASITGVLQDKSTGLLLPGRMVTVQGTNLSGITNGSGSFFIAGVPNSSVTLVIVDASGVANGTFSADISRISGSPRNLGTIELTVSTGAGAPPGTPTF